MNTENQETLAPTSQNTPPPLKDAPVHAGTPWPEAGKMLGNLFKIRKDWLIPFDSNNVNDTATAANPKPPIKLEPQNQETPKAEKCGWQQDCPFCKKEEKNMMATTKTNSSRKRHSR